jgi:hypothetical protein
VDAAMVAIAVAPNSRRVKCFFIVVSPWMRALCWHRRAAGNREIAARRRFQLARSV